MGSFKVKEPPEINASGYVVKSLEAALWAFYSTSSFKEGCLKVGEFSRHVFHRFNNHFQSILEMMLTLLEPFMDNWLVLFMEPNQYQRSG